MKFIKKIEPKDCIDFKDYGQKKLTNKIVKDILMKDYFNDIIVNKNIKRIEKIKDEKYKNRFYSLLYFYLFIYFNNIEYLNKSKKYYLEGLKSNNDYIYDEIYFSYFSQNIKIDEIVDRNYYSIIAYKAFEETKNSNYLRNYFNSKYNFNDRDELKENIKKLEEETLLYSYKDYPNIYINLILKLIKINEIEKAIKYLTLIKDIKYIQYYTDMYDIANFLLYYSDEKKLALKMLRLCSKNGISKAQEKMNEYNLNSSNNIF